MPRPKKQPPDNAIEKVTNLAERGVKETDIAKALGVSYDVWKRWKTEDEDIKKAFQEARQIEEEKLVGILFEKAMDGDRTSAIFLLKARHGYIEGDKSVNANQVNVQITLPGAKDEKQYLEEVNNG